MIFQTSRSLPFAQTNKNCEFLVHGISLEINFLFYLEHLHRFGTLGLLREIPLSMRTLKFSNLPEVEVKSKLISNWLRRLYAMLFKQPKDSLEEWGRLEFRKPTPSREREYTKHGAAS